MAKKYLHQLSEIKINAFIKKVFAIVERYEEEFEDYDSNDVYSYKVDTEKYNAEIAEIMEQQSFIVPDDWKTLDGIDFQDAVHPMDNKVYFEGLKRLYLDMSEMEEERIYSLNN